MRSEQIMQSAKRDVYLIREYGQLHDVPAEFIENVVNMGFTNMQALTIFKGFRDLGFLDTYEIPWSSLKRLTPRGIHKCLVSAYMLKEVTLSVWDLNYW